MIAEDTKGPIWMSECVPSGHNSSGGGPLSCQIIYPVITSLSAVIITMITPSLLFLGTANGTDQRPGRGAASDPSWQVIIKVEASWNWTRYKYPDISQHPSLFHQAGESQGGGRSGREARLAGAHRHQAALGPEALVAPQPPAPAQTVATQARGVWGRAESQECPRERDRRPREAGVLWGSSRGWSLSQRPLPRPRRLPLPWRPAHASRGAQLQPGEHDDGRPART